MRNEIDIEPTTEVFIGWDEEREQGFMCTSSEVINAVFDDISRSVDEDLRLSKLTIQDFWDKNALKEWPMS